MRVTRPGHRVGAGAAAADQLRRLAVGREAQVVRVLLRPLQPGLARRRPGAAARSRCRAPPGSPTACPWPRRRSAAVTLRVVVERAGPATKLVRSALTLSSASPVMKQARFMRVGADVADAAGRPGPGRVGAPVGLLLAGVLELGGQPVLGVLGLDHPDPCRAARRPPSGAPAGPSGSRYSCGSARTRSPTSRPARRACVASFSVVVSGLSQMTWMPRSRNALAAAKWTWFGVTIATASIPSLRRSSRLAISAKSP